MTKRRQLVTFVHGFGRKDLFTGVSPERLWGWARNVGVLVAHLQVKGIYWREVYATDLSDLQVETDLIILRDWRYSLEEVRTFRDRHVGIPVVSMVFQGPRRCLEWQEYGEMMALFDLAPPLPGCGLAPSDAGIFTADRTVIRSQLMADLFIEMGADAGSDRLVRMPHAPIWSHNEGGIVPAKLPTRRRTRNKATFDILFIGDSIIRKGLFRLYGAFRMLDIPGKRLHLYNRFLHPHSTGMDAPCFSTVRTAINEMLSASDVQVHAPYRDLAGLAKAFEGIDLLVCPSLIDHGPNTLVEACQLGVPILASTMCGATADLPQEAFVPVTAPRWWSEDEHPEAFTLRVAESISRFHKSHNDHPMAYTYAADKALDRITGTWEAILNTLLSGNSDPNNRADA